MAGFDMNDKKKTAGVCIYFCVAIFSLSAFCCGIAATGYCGFVSRDIQIKSDRTEFCDSLQMETEVCATLLDNHGVGFFGWQADVSIDQTACFSYTQYVSGMYICPYCVSHPIVVESDRFLINCNFTFCRGGIRYSPDGYKVQHG